MCHKMNRNNENQIMKEIKVPQLYRIYRTLSGELRPISPYGSGCYHQLVNHIPLKPAVLFRINLMKYLGLYIPFLLSFSIF